MTLMPQNIERILSLGGGVSVNASQYMPMSLERFAAIASRSNATLIIRNCNILFPQTMERISSLGKGKVIFEID